MILLLFATLIAMLAMGFPVAIALAGSSILFILVTDQVSLTEMLSRIVVSLSSYSLLVVPLLIFAGNLMDSVGILRRIYAFTVALFGFLPGGPGHAEIGASVIRGATAGVVMDESKDFTLARLKIMRASGYDKGSAIGVAAAASAIGPLIPLSLPLIIYGRLTLTSFSQILLAGLLPGLVVAACLMLTVARLAKRQNSTRGIGFSAGRAGARFASIVLPLMPTAIVLFGLLSGLFTPTEISAFVALLALFLAVAVYGALSARQLIAVSVKTIEMTAVVFFILAAAEAFSWALYEARFVDTLAQAVFGVTENKVLLLLLVDVVLIAVGCFLRPVAGLAILIPILLPMISHIGIDPIHFGVIMVLGLSIGRLMPPAGNVLHGLARDTDVSVDRCAAATRPFLLPLIVALLLVTFIPAISTTIPTFFRP